MCRVRLFGDCRCESDSCRSSTFKVSPRSTANPESVALLEGERQSSGGRRGSCSSPRGEVEDQAVRPPDEGPMSTRSPRTGLPRSNRGLAAIPSPPAGGPPKSRGAKRPTSTLQMGRLPGHQPGWSASLHGREPAGRCRLGRISKLRETGIDDRSHPGATCG